jgi:tRNA-dihydrouridine synthase A
MPLNAATAAARLSSAPMMDWTDRHCRVFHRTLSRRALLYTEMIAAPALVRGRAYRLLDHDAVEHPVAVQLGGSDPSELAEAARIAADHGFDEINLNVGCPSDRVQSGCFGAVLMRDPGLVAEICAAMIVAQPRPVTVKCRIGVDDQVPEEVLPAFLETVSAAGVTRFAIHARKAWLQGLSPKENREIPPLDYPLVHAMKRACPHLDLSINGGVQGLDEVEAHLDAGMDGVMVGRAAYHRPADILLDADRRIFGDTNPSSSPAEAVEAFLPHIARELAAGVRLHSMTRHMLGLFAGRPGARVWRRILSEGAARPGAGLDLVHAALAAVQGETLRAAS